MKTTIILIALAFVVTLFACSDEQITNFSNEKLVELQNDENWEEITDIDTVYHSSYGFGAVGEGTFCLNRDKVEYGVHLKSLQDLEEVFNGTPIVNINAEYNCADSLQPYIIKSGIDFNERDYFVNYIIFNPVDYKRSIFINRKDKIVQYVVELKQNENSGYEIGINYWDFIGIPKIPDGYTVKIDTLNIPLH